MKNAVAYIRVSTENQEEKYGIDAQHEAIEKYAAQKGYNIIAWYEEIGSGAKRRPIMDSIASGTVITNPPIEAVIVYKNDRIARDSGIYFYYLYQLELKNIQLIATQEDFIGDLTKPMMNMCRSIFQCVAEIERDNITCRTSAGRKVKAKTGGYAGGRAPYGYRVEGHELVVDETEAELVRAVFEMYGNIPASEIVKVLTDKGYRARNGKVLVISNIMSIKKNESFYKGYYKYSDTEWVRGKHEPILKDGE